VRLIEVTNAALVLGSTQPPVDARGIDVVRRRSGGGAVLVAPDEIVWADVFVPAGDQLWVEDVGVAFHWLGRAWVDTLAELGVVAQWHDGPMVCSEWCRQVCFAGLGPGEVAVDGRKVVGISQRRTRAGSLFQCAALLRWDPHTLVAHLGLGEEALAAIAGRATALRAPGAEVTGNAIEAAFLAVLQGS